jgi:hypothetical protein
VAVVAPPAPYTLNGKKHPGMATMAPGAWYGENIMPESLLLRDATVQDIQLELLRRTTFNALDGEKVVASLLKHRELWESFLLDRPGVPGYAEPRSLLIGGLIRLRDLADNIWNADTLYILTRKRDHARQLARIIEEEDRGGEVRLFKDQKELDMALGTGRQEYGLVTVWWD